MVKFEIKKRNESGQWKHIDICFYAGKTLKELLLELDEQEVVIELVIDAQCCFLCGTQYWLERMQLKGAAMRFETAIKELSQSRPNLLLEGIPRADEVCSVFPGAVVKTHSQN